MLFQLCYTCHGGSGLNFTMADALELNWGKLQWWLDRLQEQRAREASAMRGRR